MGETSQLTGVQRKNATHLRDSLTLLTSFFFFFPTFHSVLDSSFFHFFSSFHHIFHVLLLLVGNILGSASTESGSPGDMWHHLHLVVNYNYCLQKKKPPPKTKKKKKKKKKKS